jgi:hypothetical protein
LAKLTRIEKQRLVLIELLYQALESIDQPLESPCRFMDTRNRVPARSRRWFYLFAV